jgi:hypothetical protein
MHGEEERLRRRRRARCDNEKSGRIGDKEIELVWGIEFSGNGYLGVR